MKIEPKHGPFKLAEALRLKRGKTSKKETAKAIGVSVPTYTKLEDAGKRFTGNTDAYSQHLARLWVNK